MLLYEYLSFSEKSLDFLRFFPFLRFYLFDSRISLQKEISLNMEALLLGLWWRADCTTDFGSVIVRARTFYL